MLFPMTALAGPSSSRSKPQQGLRRFAVDAGAVCLAEAHLWGIGVASTGCSQYATKTSNNYDF